MILCPFTSASIAQVRSSNFKDGNKVAVKVQNRSGRKVISDLEILFYLANLADRTTSFAPHTFQKW